MRQPSVDSAEVQTASGHYDRVVSAPAPSRRFAKVLASFGDVADPRVRLKAVREAREALERLEQESVAEARAAGVTWGEIGTLYGVSKQAAQQRFRRPSGREATDSANRRRAGG